MSDLVRHFEGASFIVIYLRDRFATEKSLRAARHFEGASLPIIYFHNEDATEKSLRATRHFEGASLSLFICTTQMRLGNLNVNQDT